MHTDRSQPRAFLTAVSAAFAAAVFLTMPGLATSALAQDMPAVDGDEALRCAVQRAVDMAQVRQLRDIVAADSATLSALRDVAAGKATAGDRLAMLAALGLVHAGEGADAGVTALGKGVIALDDAGSASQASVVLPLGTSQAVTVARPGAVAHLRLDTAGSGGATIVVVVTPHAADGDACSAGFDPVVRAGLAGMPDLQVVARGSGPGRAATLLLHNVADGAPVELSVDDVVGAPGSFDVQAQVWPAEVPAIDGAMALLPVADGPLAYEQIETNGDRTVIGLSLEETYDTPTLSIRGLAGAQPGVRVYAADAFGNVGNEVIYTSSFAPTIDATVDFGDALGPGYYVATVEDLGGHPGTFLVAYSSSGSSSGFRVAGSVEIGGETAQVLGSDLAFTISEPGWYAFSTWSYDEIDPVMTLTDAAGNQLYYSDDAAFGLHPLIIAELAPGDYGLAIDGFDGASGDITLGAWRVTPRTLDLGTANLEQEIANDPSQPNFNAYFVPVVGNELVDVDVEGLGGDFDSTIALYDTSDMSVWNADDDGGVGYGSRIIDSFDGRSLLAVVSSYDGARGGAFSISAVDHAAMENIAETAVAIGSHGPEVLGNLASESDIAWFKVPAGEGWYTATIHSDTMPSLSMDLFSQQADGYYWIDSMEGYDGTTELSFDGDAEHDLYILVRNPGGDSTGDFRISLE